MIKVWSSRLRMTPLLAILHMGTNSINPTYTQYIVADIGGRAKITSTDESESLVIRLHCPA